jgi:hypothetical protein
VLRGVPDECWDKVVRLDEQGPGAFVAMNETDGKGRAKKTISREHFCPSMEGR